MSDDSEKKTLAPHILIIAVIVVVIIAVLLWPSKEEPAPVTEEVPAEEMPLLPDEPDDFQPAPPPEPVDIDPVDEPEPMPEQPEPEPEPLDVSDKGVEEALNAISGTEEANNLIVNEGLIQRFVVTVTNLANDEMPAAQQVPLTAPEQTFKVYRQADKEWIDAASYKRYTPYVTMMESFDNEALLDLFKRYKGEIQSKYDEIGQPGQPFESVVVEAIDQLLDTPEVPVPVEVYSDSVAYKYADPQLEELSTPQKQLLRTGPDNMRRIKAKLRELKSLLADDGF